MEIIYQHDLKKLFGDPRSAQAKSFLGMIDLTQFDLSQVTGLKGGKFYGHKLLQEPLVKVFQSLQDSGLLEELETFDGCYNVRAMKGNPNNFSVHSWGLAVDFNAADNPYGGEPSFSDELVECFTANGFEWGGNWSTPDGMHFQLPHIRD